jgi:hypothetical protein
VAGSEPQGTGNKSSKHSLVREVTIYDFSIDKYFNGHWIKLIRLLKGIPKETARISAHPVTRIQLKLLEEIKNCDIDRVDSSVVKLDATQP